MSCILPTCLRGWEANVHTISNLTEVDPWQQAAVDAYRKVGYELIDVIKGVGTW